jgi:hypothetical protein
MLGTKNNFYDGVTLNLSKLNLTVGDDAIVHYTVRDRVQITESFLLPRTSLNNMATTARFGHDLTLCIFPRPVNRCGHWLGKFG